MCWSHTLKTPRNCIEREFINNNRREFRVFIHRRIRGNTRGKNKGPLRARKNSSTPYIYGVYIHIRAVKSVSSASGPKRLGDFFTIANSNVGTSKKNVCLYMCGRRKRASFEFL